MITVDALTKTYGDRRPDSGSVLFDGVPFHRLERPVASIGAALDASAHPGRTARNHLRTLCAMSGGWFGLKSGGSDARS